MTLSEAARNTIIDSERINNEQQRQREQQRQQAEKEYNDLVQQEQALQEKLAQQQSVDERKKIEESYEQQIREAQQRQNEKLAKAHASVFGEGGSRNRSEYNTLVNKITKDYSSIIGKLSREKQTELSYYDYRVQFPGQILQGSVRDTFIKSGGQVSLVSLQQKQDQALEAKKAAQRKTDIAKAQSYQAAEKARFENLIAEFKQERQESDKTQTNAVNALFKSTPTKAGDLVIKAEPPKRELFQPEPDPIEPNYKAIESFEKTQKAKADLLNVTLESRPKSQEQTLSKEIAKDSDAFLAKSPKKASSILGETKEKSEQAVFTFEETQSQQKDLFQKMTSALSAKDAIKLKELAQESNIYVGTPQTANTKKGKAEQGVLIEKRIESTKEELTDYFTNTSDLVIETETPTVTKTISQESYWTIPDPNDPTANLKTKKGQELQFMSEESANLYIQRVLGKKTQTVTTQADLASPVSYEFVNEEGKKIEPTTKMLWDQMLLNMTEVSKPSKADTEFNKDLRERMKPGQDLIIYPEDESSKPLPGVTIVPDKQTLPMLKAIPNDKTSGSVMPFIQSPFLVEVQKTATEFAVLGEDIIQMANPNYQRKIKPMDPSLETIAISEGLETGKYLFGISDVKPKESETIKYIKEKIKTPEGVESLVASASISAALIYATQGRSAFVSASKPVVKEAQALIKVAEEIFKPKIADDFRTARIKELNPDITDPKDIERLKNIMYPKQSESELLQSKQLQELYPNLPKEKIDFMVAQTQKAQQIAEYEQKAKLTKLLKERFPEMPDEKITQKVATMTAKESSDIPYNIEKISSKSYLISSGREAKATDYPFIVVTFKKSRFGKEIGTYDVYEPLADKSIFPTDLLIQRAPSKAVQTGSTLGELKGGEDIAKTKTTRITRYKIGDKNLYKVINEDSNLAMIGTIKTGSLSELVKYPKETIDSMIASERKTAVLESKQELDALAKQEAKAKQQYNAGLKELETKTKSVKPNFVEKSNFEIPTSKADNVLESQSRLGFPNEEKINLSIKQEQLKNIAKTTAKANEKIDTKTINSVLGFSAYESVSTSIASRYDASIKQPTSQSTVPKSRVDSDFGLKTMQQEKINLETKSEINNRVSEKIITDLAKVQERRQKLDPLFSLITSTDSITDTTQDQTTRTKERYRLKEEFDQIFPKPEPTTKTKLKTPPNRPPGFILDISDDDLTTTKKKGGKQRITYFRWNVNTESVGQYLPTADITTGRTSKVIKKIDRLQRKVNKAGYYEKQAVKESKYFKLGLKESNAKLEGKSNIVNISKPVGKEAKKFLKKFTANIKF